MSHDIIDAIATFRVAFLRENMKPPTVIILPDHEEGMRLLSYLRNTANWSAQIGDTKRCTNDTFFSLPVSRLNSPPSLFSSSCSTWDRREWRDCL